MTEQSEDAKLLAQAETVAVGDDTDEERPSQAESWLREAVRAPHQSAALPLPQRGTVIGEKYRIEELIGKGGMGAVYRATHTVSGKSVALKWMLRASSDERAAQRFTREARAAGRIDHPNVVNVYDIGQDGEVSYLVMELLRGESLRTRLNRGPLSPKQVVDLLLPVLRGVAAAHREGVIHRDLKPDNVFLCQGPSGEEREAKVLDFGISSISAAEHEHSTALTREGAVVGTPSYMSPEQLESAKNLDERSDVYSIGVILYEALTGKLPFEGDSYSALVLACANQEPRPPSELRPEIPPALEKLVLQAMAKDRSERQPSIEALLAALLPFASAPSEKPAQEKRAVGWLIGAIGLLLALLAAVWLGSASPRADALTPSKAETPSVPHPPTAAVVMTTEPAVSPSASAADDNPGLTPPPAESAAKKPTAARRLSRVPSMPPLAPR